MPATTATTATATATGADIVQWRLDTRVTLTSSTAEGPVEITRRSRTLLAVFLLAVSLAIVSSHLRRELRSLQAQIQRANAEISQLRSECQQLKREARRERAVVGPSSTLAEEEGGAEEDRGQGPEPRSDRVRRDEGRGPLVATFIGGIPEQHVTDSVYVGPWVKSTSDDSRYSFDKFHLVENRKSVEVTASGLYMISVQIFYFGEPNNYSYWILLTSEGASRAQKLAKCAAASADSAAEVSCYTSVITLLRKGDRLHVQQQERDRLINMRKGHSYMQLALLSNGARKNQ